jgi:hypothetical protein
MLHVHRTTENKTQQEHTNFYAQNVETKFASFQNKSLYKPLGGGDPPANIPKNKRNTKKLTKSIGI